MLIYTFKSVNLFEELAMASNDLVRILQFVTNKLITDFLFYE